MLSELEKDLIKAMCACDLKIERVAKCMCYSRGNIVYHIEKIADKTGLDPRKFYDLIKLLEMCKDGQQ